MILRRVVEFLPPITQMGTEMKTENEGRGGFQCPRCMNHFTPETPTQLVCSKCCGEIDVMLGIAIGPGSESEGSAHVIETKICPVCDRLWPATRPNEFLCPTCEPKAEAYVKKFVPATGMKEAHGTRYVAGFMFSEDRQWVALIRKLKPLWQAGKLNGIGGKVEPGEDPIVAMSREFMEETGCATTVLQWEQFAEMGGTNDGGEGSFHVDFFVTVGDVDALKSMEEELVRPVCVSSMHPLRTDVIENLPWLIALAFDYLKDGRPSMVTAVYGKGRVVG
jgi:8-oxo-dGTP diphosphatase